MKLKANYVARCLRCKGALRVIRDLNPPRTWGVTRWAMKMGDNALWCDVCGLIYDDFGKAWNRIRIYRILPPNICRGCGRDDCVLEFDEVKKAVVYAKCKGCGNSHWVDEFDAVMECTRGWVNQVNAGKKIWRDEGKKFVRVEGW